MRKNPEQLEKRKHLVRMLIEKPEDGIRYMECQLLTIRQTVKSCDRMKAISELLFLSDATIENDLYKDR